MAQDRAITTFSMHGASNYPMHKETSDIDIDFPDGTEDAEYLEALGGISTCLFQMQDPALKSSCTNAASMFWPPTSSADCPSRWRGAWNETDSCSNDALARHPRGVRHGRRVLPQRQHRRPSPCQHLSRRHRRVDLNSAGHHERGASVLGLHDVPTRVQFAPCELAPFRGESLGKRLTHRVHQLPITTFGKKHLHGS